MISFPPSSTHRPSLSSPPGTPPLDHQNVDRLQSSPAYSDDLDVLPPFEWERDARGDWVRISNGSSNPSPAPSTPDLHSPILSHSPVPTKRSSPLSRAESAPDVISQPTPVSRQFSRTVSGPLATTISSTPVASGARLPQSTGLSRTGRKISGAPRRVKLDEVRETNDRARQEAESWKLQPSSSATPSSRPLTDVMPVPQRSLSAHGRQVLPVPSRTARMMKKVETIAEAPDGEEEAAARMSAAALTSSTGARPRRSYSLSEADGEDSDHPHYQQYLKSEFARGARRVTLEQKLKQEREIAREEGYNLRAAEEAEERLAYELINAHAQPSETGLSGSPTHVPSSNPRPPYAHQRMDSDTVKTFGTSSPTAVEHPRSFSPTGRSYSSGTNAAALSVSAMGSMARHRRSPTAPEAPVASTALALQQTAKVWDDEDGNVGHYQADRHVPAPGKITDSASMPPPPVPVARVHSVPPQPSHQPPAFSSSDRARNMIVNKKQYARLDMIGKGGSSKVYRVMSGNNEIFAIKRVALDKTDAETMSGYMNEISLLKRLDGNRRIIRLIDSEVKAGPNGSKGYLMLVMECGEIDLARLLQEQQKEPLDLVWISYYWKQILQAVHVIHEEKIVHSDLKPANFVLVKGQLKLIDFGIANAIANDTTNIHRDHQIGTVNYMSPEAIELPDGMRRLKVGRQSDVWSLGCILYQMVYGRPPFHDLSVVQKMRAIPSESYAINFPEFATPPITGSPPKDLESLKVRVPVEVIEGMKGCLIRNPKERATIPELLAQNWLTLREPAMPPLPPSPPPPAPPQLKDDEAIISPHFMAQLLQHGMGIGNRGEVWSGADLEREAKRLVAELQSVYTR